MSSSEAYIVVHHVPGAEPRYIGAFPTASDVIDHMNATSCRGNNPFKGCGIPELPIGESMTCMDFAPVEIVVSRMKVQHQTKNIYVRTAAPIAISTRKIADATTVIPVTECPMCGKRGVAVDEDGHCSYECAAGT